MPTTHTPPAERHATGRDHYLRLAVMVALSFLSMYVLMFAMVDRFGNVFNSLNQVYMAGLMTAPMVIIELFLMRGMYSDTKLNMLILGASALALIGCFFLIRQQTAITDQQFLRSMIPHHAGAILMCERAPLQNREIRNLCASIIKGQNEEIAQMKALMRSR